MRLIIHSWVFRCGKLECLMPKEKQIPLANTALGMTGFVVFRRPATADAAGRTDFAPAGGQSPRTLGRRQSVRARARVVAARVSSRGLSPFRTAAKHR